MYSYDDYNDCQHSNTEVRDKTDKNPHVGLYCADCGKWLRWVKQEKNEGKRSTKGNAKWLKLWREKLGGELVCHWCLVKESEYPGIWYIDHIMPVSKAGEDEFENTRPLCAECHEERHVQEKRVDTLLRKPTEKGGIT